MDLICPRCLEPWDNDELHENDLGVSYDEAYRLFRTKGCGEVFGGSCKPPADEAGKSQAAILTELADLMGNDSDGYMSMAEDAARF